MIEIALSIVLGFFNLVSLKFVPPLELNGSNRWMEHDDSKFEYRLREA